MKRIFAVAAFLLVIAPPTESHGAADIPEFDPDAPVDLDKYEGNEWPDEREVAAAFESRYEKFDACVAAEKDRTGFAGQLEGDAGMAIMLNPAGQRPLGVNSTFPNEYEGREELVRCMRNATGSAPFPRYWGPPLVVKFEFEIDPGTEWVDEDED